MTDYTKKLVAWLHDPAEKQLVLMRDPVGHEGGSIVEVGKAIGLATRPAMRKEKNGAWTKLGYDKLKLPDSVHLADCLAAAADRPNWPKGDDAGRYPAFEAVRFAREAELIHPLSGARLKPGVLDQSIGVEQIKLVSQHHFEHLIQENDDDLRKTFLAFWRFGPEAGKDASELGALWPMLPADSRIPDHSIWSHVDTVAAIHTALVGDEQKGPDQPALLVMSFGPVQSFIGQARSTSDLWAGSHLLSNLVWEAMKPIVNHLGPDVMVFPALRGVPVVDQWLMSDDVGGAAFKQLFTEIDSELLSDNTDTNPLFAASLPNKFMAIVPARQAPVLAEQAIRAIRQAARDWAVGAAQRAFDAAGVAVTPDTLKQIDQQLAGFPEAAWAAASWPIDSLKSAEKLKDGKVVINVKDVAAATAQLHLALDAIHPELKKHGVFDDKVWLVLTKELKLEGLQFWSPNTGILYPAVYDLAERSLNAAKATRGFMPVLEHGHRCTLTGEAEWLTDDRELLGLSREDRKTRSVWGKLAKAKKSWVKPGEHLGAIATLKRLWPTLFAERVKELTCGDVRRFVISTHALALSTTLEQLARSKTGEQQAALAALALQSAEFEPVALPRSLLRTLRKAFTATEVQTLRRLPSMLERDGADEDGDGDGAGLDEPKLCAALRTLFAEAKPEAYYALILMDGDRMGGWLAGNEDEYKLTYRQTWHSKILSQMDMYERRDPQLKDYLNTKRPVSPGRHGAISQALNDFSTRLARHVVEDCCKGKLLYAGGDDVLALVAVDDLFDCMQLLRLAYSGIAPSESMGLQNRVAAFDGRRVTSDDSSARLLMKDGFGYLLDKDRASGRLMTLMGHKATASMGAVVAHHSAPLSRVLRDLRAAESQAKNTKRGDINRDAFCLRVLKRGGGEVNVISPWWPLQADQQPNTSKSALALMKRLAEMLAGTAFSRGAIYRAQLWFEGLTDEEGDGDDQNSVWREQMSSSLAFQFERQAGSAELAREIVDFVCQVMQPKHPKTAIENFLVTAEFFAREARSVQLAGRKAREQRQGVRA